MVKKRFLSSAFLVAALAAAGAGCTHMTTKVPGVLDMRSDMSAAPVDTSPVTPPPRTGAEAIFLGEGVVGAGAVTITDRRYWAVRLMPILNDSTTEEIAAALGTGALRNVNIGEEVSVIGAAMMVGVQLLNVIPGVGLVSFVLLPPHDMKLSGTRISLGNTPAASGTGR